MPITLILKSAYRPEKRAYTTANVIVRHYTFPSVIYRICPPIAYNVVLKDRGTFSRDPLPSQHRLQDLPTSGFSSYLNIWSAFNARYWIRKSSMAYLPIMCRISFSLPVPTNKSPLRGISSPQSWKSGAEGGSLSDNTPVSFVAALQHTVPSRPYRTKILQHENAKYNK